MGCGMWDVGGGWWVVGDGWWLGVRERPIGGRGGRRHHLPQVDEGVRQRGVRERVLLRVLQEQPLQGRRKALRGRGRTEVRSG